MDGLCYLSCRVVARARYAVIFTAIARALQIPSRIVVGYLLSGGSAGMHAWVEAEIEPGLWRAIEPQSANSLQQMYTRFYFPLTRGTFLEDKSQNWAEWMTQIVSTSLAFKKYP